MLCKIGKSKTGKIGPRRQTAQSEVRWGTGGVVRPGERGKIARASPELIKSFHYAKGDKQLADLIIDSGRERLSQKKK